MSISEMMDLLLEPYGDMLTPAEVRTVLRSGRNYVYKKMNSGELLYVNLGNSRRIPKVALKAFLEERSRREAKS